MTGDQTSPTSAPRAAPDLLAALEALLTARAPETVIEALAEPARAAGFGGIVHAETSGFGASAFVPALTRIRTSRPPPDPDRFTPGRFLSLPAVLRAARCSGSEALSAPGCGIEAGRLVSLAPREAGRRALVAFTAGRAAAADLDRRWEDHGRLLTALADLADLRLAGLQPAAVPGLRPRQREVLAWVASGKTTAEIAVILGLTPAAVEKHLRLARDALSAATTAQAIARAVRMDLIESL